jgi:glutathione S-transferase
MKLYYSKGACSLGVRIVIHELGLLCEYESVDLKTKITATGANFMSVNPKGAVATLVTDDNMVLTENAVIQQYLADQYHGTKLLPPVGDLKRYKVLEWLNFVSTEIHKAFGPIFNSKISHEMKAEFFIPVIKSKFDYVNQALDKKPYLMGKEFTLPDAYLFVMLTWTKHANIDINEYPNLARYFSELKQRKTIMDAIAEE